MDDRLQAFLLERMPAVIEHAQELIKDGHHDEDMIGVVSDGTGRAAPLGALALTLLRSAAPDIFARMACKSFTEIETPPPGMFAVVVFYEGEMRCIGYPLDILRAPLRPAN